MVLALLYHFVLNVRHRWTEYRTRNKPIYVADPARFLKAGE